MKANCFSVYDIMQADNMNGWKERGNNVSKCDTKGCIPLEVQIKRYLLAGKKLEELRAVNTFEDYDKAYADVPIITEDMDVTEIIAIEQEVKERLAQMALQRESEAVSTTQPSAGAKEPERVAPTSEGGAVESVVED